MAKSQANPRAAADAAAGDDRSQYLTFVVNGETYAIDILVVKEILEYGTLTRVPMMPRSVRGVINLRGAVVPVVDLSARFGAEPSVPGKRTCIVIVEIEDEESVHVLGVTVDAVNEVLEIPAEQIEPAPAFGPSIRTDFIAGMAREGDHFVVVLDVHNVLALEELSEIAKLAGEPAGAKAAPVAAQGQAPVPQPVPG